MAIRHQKMAGQRINGSANRRGSASANKRGNGAARKRGEEQQGRTAVRPQGYQERAADDADGADERGLSINPSKTSVDETTYDATT